MVVSYTLILVTIKWYFPIILIISNIPYIISLFIQNRMEYDNYKEISMKNRQLNYWINVLTQRSWVKDVKIYNLFNYINIKICRMLEEICLKENSIIKTYELKVLNKKITLSYGFMVSLSCNT